MIASLDECIREFTNIGVSMDYKSLIGGFANMIFIVQLGWNVETLHKISKIKINYKLNILHFIPLLPTIHRSHS
jgi:hypothetical protein